MSSTESESPVTGQVPVVVFLSGPRRGQMERLEQETLRVVVVPEEDIRFLAPDDERAAVYHATLHRSGDTYEIAIAPDREVWIDGQRVTESQTLRSGDLLEIGHEGPVLRYRLYARGVTPRKSVAEAFADSFNGARADGRTSWARSTRFLANITRDLATQTSFWFRVLVLILLTIMVVSVVFLVAQGLRLQKRVAVEGMRIEGIAEMLEKTGAEALSREELLALQADVEARLTAALQRLEALEARAGVGARVIAAASPAVAFLQGAFGFIDPKSGKRLRYIRSPEGVLFTLEETGSLVEIPFTGTGFAVSEEGLFLTNRHVAEPWVEDPRMEIAKEHGLQPVIQRLLAFLPDIKDPLELTLLHASDEADLALLKTPKPIKGVPALELNPQPPQPGDPVLVLGYPLGIEGLIVRTSPAFLEQITADGAADFWLVAQRLSQAGYIKPLATRGIVSQVSEEVVLYDAETTIGGSGGPVLDLGGRVIAVNAAIMAEFGGSNFGVPAAYAVRFLAESPPAKQKQGAR